MSRVITPTKPFPPMSASPKPKIAPGTPALLMLVHCQGCNRPFEVRCSNSGNLELVHDRNTGCSFDGKRFAPPVIKIQEIK